MLQYHEAPWLNLLKLIEALGVPSDVGGKSYSRVSESNNMSWVYQRGILVYPCKLQIRKQLFSK